MYRQDRQKEQLLVLLDGSGPQVVWSTLSRQDQGLHKQIPEQSQAVRSDAFGESKAGAASWVFVPQTKHQ